MFLSIFIDSEDFLMKMCKIKNQEKPLFIRVSLGVAINRNQPPNTL